MPKFESISSLEPDRRYSALVEQALATRAMLEHAWSEETAFQVITLQPDDAPSRGQCGISAVWFSQHLVNQGVDAYVAEGKIHLRSGEGDDHVWVEVRGITEQPLVADLTSDQYQSLLGTPVHIGEYADSTQTIGRYTPEEYLHPFTIPRKKLMARYALLEDAVRTLPKRHRITLK